MGGISYRNKNEGKLDRYGKKKKPNWEYRFYVDLSGNVSNRYMDVLLEALRADCLTCRLLGVYRADGGRKNA